MAIFLSTKIYGYAFTSDFNKGFYWKSFPVHMQRFATNSYDGSNLQNLVDQATSDWESVVGKNLWNIDNVVVTQNYSGNFIRWSENFGSETGYDPSTTLAITIRYNRGTFFESVVIILNGSIAYLRQNIGNTLRTTILHEIGHTIGLDHTTIAGAIMYPTVSSNYTLQADDVQGMNALVDETLRRQEVGYVSPYAASSSTKNGFAACGTVDDISRKSGPKGNGMQFVFTVALGLLMASAIRWRKVFKSNL
jgi:hypothetical protein